MMSRVFIVYWLVLEGVLWSYSFSIHKLSNDVIKHGQGTFTSSDGEKYVGEYKDGKEHGQGTYTWTNGSKYVGEYKDGKRNGQGTWTSSDGIISFLFYTKYIGEYKDDNRWNGTIYDKYGYIEYEVVNGEVE